MKKILFIATIHKHFLAFHVPYIKWLKEQGFVVHTVANGSEIIPYVEKQYALPIERQPLKFNNILAIKKLKQIIAQEQYALIHCHTAMGAVVARLAAKGSRKKHGTKVLYTVHGFHFFKGSPKSYWLFYYPVEKLLSRFTDTIVTINREDYELVLNRGFRNHDTYLINGIGVREERFFVPNLHEKEELRNKYGYKINDFILIYTAEYIQRKNHKFIIKSLPLMIKQIPEIKVLFAGRGGLMKQSIKLAEALGVGKYIDFLGFTNNVEEFIALSDIGVSVSRQEGLGLNLAEEMFSGLPVVATLDRGHKELVNHGVNGYMFEQNNQEGFIGYIIELYNNPAKRKTMGEEAHRSVQKFSLENSLESMAEIYNSLLKA